MTQPDREPSAWWRHPMMWLVIGGPLAVVLAAAITAVIAVQGADPVLRTKDVQQSRSAAPAMQARNHAATPVPAKP
jgi:hypothetical protein